MFTEIYIYEHNYYGIIFFGFFVKLKGKQIHSGLRLGSFSDADFIYLFIVK